LVFAVVLPFLDNFTGAYRSPRGLEYVTRINPFHPFFKAFASGYMTGPNKYFYSLISSHLLAWVFIGGASWALPRSWQDRPAKSNFKNHFANWALSGRVTNPEIRARLLEKNPVLWLISGNNSFRWATWALAILAAGGCISFCFTKDFLSPSGNVRSSVFLIGLPVLFLFKILVAVRAPRFFAEARQSGALEMLLSTPLTSREIIRGQRQGLSRLFIGPVIVVLIGMAGPWLLHSLVTTNIQSIPFPVASTFLAVLTQAFFGIFIVLLAIAWGALGMFAAGSFGMWMGLTCKKPNLAGFWTVLLAGFLPMVCCSLSFSVDIFLLIFSTVKLSLDLRIFVQKQQTRTTRI
jgi:hypothetical protein